MNILLLLVTSFISIFSGDRNNTELSKLIYISYNVWYDDEAIASIPMTKKYYKPNVYEYLEIDFETKLCKCYKKDTVWYVKNNYKTYKLLDNYSTSELTHDLKTVILNGLTNKKIKHNYIIDKLQLFRTNSIIYGDGTKNKFIYYDNDAIPNDLSGLHKIFMSILRNTAQTKVDNFKIDETVKIYRDSLCKYNIIPPPKPIER